MVTTTNSHRQSPGGTPARHVLAPLSPSSRSQESLQQKYNDALKELDTLKKDWNTERQHWRKFKRWWSKYCKEHGLDPLAADKTSKAPDSSATVYEESPKKEEPKQCRGSILSSSPPGPNAHRFRSLFGDETYDTPAAKEEYARPESPSPQRPMLSAQEYWESRVLVPETQYPYESPPRNTSDAQQYPADAVVSARKADAAPVASTSVEAIPNPPMPVASTSASSVPVASTSTLQGPIASTSAQQPATARKPPSGTQKSSRLTPSGWIQAGKPSTSQKPASSSNKSRNSASQKLFSVKKEETETPLIKRALGVDKGRPDSISKTSPSGSPQDPFAPSQISSARFQKRSSSSVNKRSIPQEADTSMLESPSTTVLLDRSPPKTRISKYLPSFPGLGKPPSPPTNYAAIYAELAEEDAQKRVKPKSRRSDVEPNSEESARKRKRDEVEGKRKKIKVEEEDKGPPSEEFEGQNFVREIRRKRREELEADPLKYKGRGAYARGMPMYAFTVEDGLEADQIIVLEKKRSILALPSTQTEITALTFNTLK